MPGRAEPGNAALSLLTVDAGGAVWALPSVAVSGVEPLETAGVEPLDVRALLGLPPVDASCPGRVLTVNGSSAPRRLLARGALALKTLDERELLPLPAALLPSAPLISHVGLVDGAPAFVVLSPARLLALPLAGARASTLPPRLEDRPC